MLSHQKLIVYQKSLTFAKQASKIYCKYSSLKDQLVRASQSIVLNIAEGACQRTSPLQKKHYRIALGSACECSAIFDLLEHAPQELHRLLYEVIAMLNKLSQ